MKTRRMGRSVGQSYDGIVGGVSKKVRSMIPRVLRQLRNQECTQEKKLKGDYDRITRISLDRWRSEVGWGNWVGSVPLPLPSCHFPLFLVEIFRR